MDLNAEIPRSLLREEQQMSDEKATENDLRSPADWCLIEGVEILDYDGWRGSAGRPITDLVSLAEFRDRLATCTQRQIPAGRPDAPTTLQRWPGGPDRRLKSCVENWPEAESCEYNPACCRFPKSCSADSYSLEYITEDHLEPVQEPPAGEHHVGMLDLSGEGNVPAVVVSDEAVDLACLAMNDGVKSSHYRMRWEPEVRTILEAAYPAVREQVAEEIAVALEAVPAEVYPEDFFPVDGTSVDCQSARVMRFAYPAAARIARDIGEQGAEAAAPGRAGTASARAGLSPSPSDPPAGKAGRSESEGSEG